MRVTFGPTKREKAYEQSHTWRLWFAWYPVRLAWRDVRGNRGGAWLEWVAYRGVKTTDSVYDNESRYEYRPPEETPLKNTARVTA